MRTNLILEVGYNHNGNIDTAKKLIKEASDLGVWGVKFQKWDIENFPDELKNKKRTDKNAFGKTYYEHRKFLEFIISQLVELREYAESLNLNFVVSGKDYNSILQLYNNGFKIIKVPSQRYLDNNIFRLLAGKKDVFKIVSTGMCYEQEIVKSKWLRYADVIMHCISDYTNISYTECNLGIMRKLKIFNGYSSHEKDGEAIIPAILMGANFIERHYTFDKEAKGTDHKISSDFNDIKNLIDDIERVECLIYPECRILSETELSNREFYRGF